MGAEAGTKLEEEPRFEAMLEFSGERAAPAVRDICEQYAVEIMRTVSRTQRAIAFMVRAKIVGVA